MQSASFLIDDNGTFWESTSYRLRSDLHALTAGDLFNDYVVKNLGFVRVTKQPRSVVVRLRPETVSQLAAISLLGWLTEERPDRVLVSTYADGAWHNELLSNRTKTFDLIASHMHRSSSDTLGDEARYDAFWRGPAAPGPVAIGGPVRAANEI